MRILILFLAFFFSATFFVFSGDSPVPILDQISLPAYEGRGVGTQGLDKARDFIIEQCKKQGLQPFFPSKDGKTPPSYTQSFRVFVGNDLGKNNNFSVGKFHATAKDYVPYSFSRSGKFKNLPLVFVGFGISLRNAGAAIYDDYEGQDVKGKIVIAFTGDPATGSKDSVFRNPSYYHYSTPMYKVQNAEMHGAAGIILVRDPYSLSTDKEPELQFLGRQGGGASVGILAVQASINFVEKFLPKGKKLRELQKNSIETQKPITLALKERASLAVELQRHVGEAQNIAVFIPSTEPKLQNEIIVMGAHYDHLGFGGDSSMDPSGTGKIHPGADDNASGVQGVFDLAVKIAREKKNRHPVIALFFSAEEIGLLGSKNFTETLPLPAGAKITTMVNLDMIGRLSQNKLSALAIKSAKEFPSIVEKVNKDFHFELMKGDSGFGSSDHASFLQLKIPSIFFTTGAHSDYHRTTDTPEKIQLDGLKRVEDFTYATIQAIDALASAPVYDPSSESAEDKPRQGRGYGVYFGSVPDFGENPIPGVLLQGVKPASPAERAGLRAGDILIGLGEVNVKNLYDFVFALRYYRPNDEVSITWMRKGKKMQAKTILMARDKQ